MTELIRPANCRNCGWSHKGPEGIECREAPPQVQAVVAATPQGPRVMGRVTSFPVVEPEWFCGRHKRRLEVAPA